ncbi:SAF domain-containing protein [Mycobacterium sp. 1274761.0]|uniref:SAF domain-containing protein n=1 Tax=Mycobacterium sp. 1274761.0 TaxID=1834077 RepID=UPI00080239F5|nr:SAF domain-containing protein [Mycobacterium sp. 1274761.0]OBK74833.1 flagellar biosynthesis protein FlgA [Mycobacterium sp. 1274761.0]
MAPRRDSALNPSVLSRLIHEWRPDWTRTAAARRVAAAALVLLAAVAAFRSDPQGERSDIVVAARDLAPGVELTAADVRIEQRLAATIPDGSRTAVADVVGSTLAGPARRGEVLTDVRLLGSRLAQSAAGRDARIVPLHLADTALLDLVRPGDVVDVLAAADQAGPGDADPRVVATDAVVVLVSEKQKGPGAGDRVVLIALPAQAANDVAGATLMQAVTLTFH